MSELLRRWRAPLTEPVGADVEPVTLDLEGTLVREFGEKFAAAEAATARVLAAIAGVDLEPLARRSPGLKGYDWPAYLRCSLARVVRVQRALALHVPAGGRVLDFGSYFGNFSLACRALGYRLEAIDAYREYGDALAPCAALLRQEGVAVHDFAEAGTDLGGLQRSAYDAVICAGVIEHVPHTPRPVLEAIGRVLRPAGVLVLDTPNLAYLYKRLALLRGETIFSPIQGQYFTDLPFEGHHREYTVPEVAWMLGAAGLEVLSIETFNYSTYAQAALSGEHAAYYRQMERDPSLREVILAVARRPPD